MLTHAEKILLVGHQVIDIHDGLKRLGEEDKLKRAEFLALAGEGTKTDINGRGLIQITQRTEDRPGDLQVVFNLEAYLALPAAKQAEMTRMGLVSMERKTIKGSNPIVKVLKK